MLHEIDLMLPQHERIQPAKSPHKKHYPRLHALMQNKQPSLQSKATVSVSSVGVRSVSGSSTSAKLVPRESKKAVPSEEPSESSASATTSSNQSFEDDESEPEALNFKSDEMPIETQRAPSPISATSTHSPSVRTSNSIAISTSIPHDSDGESIAFLSSDDESSIADEELTSPIQVHSAKTSVATTGVNVAPAANVPVGYSPAMLNLQSILPTADNGHARSSSFHSEISAESDTSTRPLADNSMSPPKTSHYGDRRKSAPFLSRQPSTSGFTTQSIASTKSTMSRSTTITNFFAQAWAGISGKPAKDGTERMDESDSEDGLEDAYSPSSSRDRRKSTSSAQMSLQKLMSLDQGHSTIR